MIERIERFVFDGKEFRDLRDVQKYVEDEIGKIVDSTPNRLTPKDALAVFNAIVQNRDRLTVLLSATYYVDESETTSRSIFAGV